MRSVTGSGAGGGTYAFPHTLPMGYILPGVEFHFLHGDDGGIVKQELQWYRNILQRSNITAPTPMDFSAVQQYLGKSERHFVLTNDQSTLYRKLKAANFKGTAGAWFKSSRHCQRYSNIHNLAF